MGWYHLVASGRPAVHRNMLRVQCVAFARFSGNHKPYIVTHSKPVKRHNLCKGWCNFIIYVFIEHSIIIFTLRRCKKVKQFIWKQVTCFLCFTFSGFCLFCYFFCLFGEGGAWSFVWFLMDPVRILGKYFRHSVH